MVCRIGLCEKRKNLNISDVLTHFENSIITSSTMSIFLLCAIGLLHLLSRGWKL